MTICKSVTHVKNRLQVHDEFQYLFFTHFLLFIWMRRTLFQVIIMALRYIKFCSKCQICEKLNPKECHKITVDRDKDEEYVTSS